jgi:hypothetical protein
MLSSKLQAIKLAMLYLGFRSFFRAILDFFRLPWQGRYYFQVAHDRRSPEL